MVQAQGETGSAQGGQRNIEAGRINALEPAALLEVAQTVMPLLPVVEVRVHKIANAPVCAGANGVSNQGILRRLVPVPHQRHNIHETGLSTGLIVYQLHEPDQLVFEESPNE